MLVTRMNVRAWVAVHIVNLRATCLPWAVNAVYGLELLYSFI